MALSVIIFALLIISLVASVNSYYEPDRISKLPGQPDVDFRQYSGYVTVDERHERSYFYYFVEAEKNPASKPLALWLIGGPGCSSVGVGAFSENGPFKPRGNILIKNEYSNNKVANMLYLESPAGVGFSYSVDKSFYKSVNDTMTAMDNFIFLKNWFSKFPEFKGREFYITGESYAGHYAPQLADLIVKNKPKHINLKGVAIGNPLLEFDTDFNSRAEFLWSHGLISDNTFDLLNSVCNYSQIRRQNESGEWTPECFRVNNQLTSEIGRYIDIFDVTHDVCLSTVSNRTRLQTQLQDGSNIDICVIYQMIVYLARKDVQKALHARLVGVPKWVPCSAVMHYDMLNLEIPMIELLGSLVKSRVRVLAYSGDQDSLLPLSGTRRLIKGLANELKLTTTRPYGSWMSRDQQVGGWVQDYGSYLSFATMRGASHFAAITQPERSLVLFDSFVSGKPLLPPPSG